MSAIITEKFRQHNANQFVESFTEAAASTYYLFLGKATAFSSTTTGGSDSSPPTPGDSPQEEFRAWDSMLGAKIITSSDIKFAVPRRNWANGTVYDMYRHDYSSSNTSTSGTSNLYDSTFFFLTSDYKLYKVLDNNGGAAFSGTEPTSTSTSPFASGGYVLKYMLTISTSDFAKYGTTDFIPVTSDSTVSAAAVDGAVESLSITAGSGYTDGTYFTAIHGDGSNAGTSSGAIARITVSSGSIVSFGLTAGTDTTIHAAGSGYTFGYINLAAAFIFSDSSLSSSSTLGSGSGGVITVISSPDDGHGANVVTELGAHYVMSAITLTQAEGDDFTTGNDFRSVGLVVDPTNVGTSTVATTTTARQSYVVKVDTNSGTFQADEVITQASTGAVGKVVEYDSTLSLLYYQQESYKGFGTSASTGGLVAFSSTATITGGTSGATGTPSSTNSETVTLANSNTLTLTSGYANPELEADSGNIIYLENRKPIQRASDQTEDIKIIIEF